MTPQRKTGRVGDDGKREALTSDLKARIARASAETESADDGQFRSATRDMSAMSRGLRLGSEFVAAVLVGGGIGFLLDQWLHTSPWLFLVMVMLGFAAGVMNVVRSAAAMNKAALESQTPPDAPGDEDKK